MGALKLHGMRSAHDEVMATGIKRQHEPPRIVGHLLESEIAESEPFVGSVATIDAAHAALSRTTWMARSST